MPPYARAATADHSERPTRRSGNRESSADRIACCPARLGCRPSASSRSPSTGSPNAGQRSMTPDRCALTIAAFIATSPSSQLTPRSRITASAATRSGMNGGGVSQAQRRPARRTAPRSRRTLRAVSRCERSMIPSWRRASFVPSSTSTRSGRAALRACRRVNAPAVVSPDSPRLITSMRSRARVASSARRSSSAHDWRSAVIESPNAATRVPRASGSARSRATTVSSSIASTARPASARHRRRVRSYASVSMPYRSARTFPLSVPTPGSRVVARIRSG